MKKLTVVLITAFTFCFTKSEAQIQISSDPYDVQLRFYQNALRHYDFQAATVALYTMLAIKPERTDLNDSLALLYFAGERYAQSYMIGEEILRSNPQRKDILELVAVSKQNLGLVKEALTDYERLYSIDKSFFYLYQIATLQYQLKRYGECIASLDQIIASPETSKQMVNIRTQGGSQEVPMNAAALNVKGICAVEMNQEQVAMDNFTKALQIFPEFALARSNMESIAPKKPTTAPATTTTKTPTTAPKTTPQQKK